MKIAIPKERRAGEARVAASPDTVKKYIGMGFEVVVESGAGRRRRAARCRLRRRRRIHRAR